MVSIYFVNDYRLIEEGAPPEFTIQVTFYVEGGGIDSTPTQKICFPPYIR